MQSGLESRQAVVLQHVEEGLRASLTSVSMFCRTRAPFVSGTARNCPIGTFGSTPLDMRGREI